MATTAAIRAPGDAERGTADARSSKRRRDRDQRRHRPDGDAGADEQEALGRDQRAHVCAGEADGAQQAELAPPLEHVAREHGRKAERAEQQTERAERLERREIRVLHLMVRRQPRASVGDVDTEIRQAIFEQRASPLSASVSGASIIQTR